MKTSLKTTHLLNFNHFPYISIQYWREVKIMNKLLKIACLMAILVSPVMVSANEDDETIPCPYAGGSSGPIDQEML